MIADNAGNLYGTAATGGSGPCSQNGISGCGTIFELSPPAQKGGTWTQTVLYSFQGGEDGAFPNAGLIADKHGNLFGVTSQGGKADCSRIALISCGVAFELSPSGGGQWTETRLYTFKGNPKGEGDRDFAAPTGVTFDGSGNLYGIAADGGRCYTNGETGTYCDGGAFALKRSRNGAGRETIFSTASRAGSRAIATHAGARFSTARAISMAGSPRRRRFWIWRHFRGLRHRHPATARGRNRPCTPRLSRRNRWRVSPTRSRF